jgi:hypothetical protein
MKVKGYSCELITEAMKDLIYADRSDILREDGVKQDYVFAQQHKRQYILNGAVDYVVTDSPIVLSAYYHPRDELFKSFCDYVMGCHKRFTNFDIYLLPNPDFIYSSEGRLHSKEESEAINSDLLSFLHSHDINPVMMSTADDFIDRIFEFIKKL